LDYLLPDLRRLYRRFTDSPLPTRVVAHLTVVSLVAIASATGYTHAQGGGGSGSESAAGARTQTGGGFPSFVSSVRAAGHPEPAAETQAFSLSALPADMAPRLDRGAPAQVPATLDALPPPMPVDPAATPLPAPNSIGEIATATGPSTRAAAPAPAAGRLFWPVPGGSISQYFHAGHLALDIAAPYGSQIISAQSGIVTSSGWRNNGGGYVISIDHGNGMHTVYNHLGSLWVSSGAYVVAGQAIGAIGCTGICTGPHVHFEVIVNGIIDNPQRYF
jgi:murein DD-endopeptidase MepM/ murein hydrolase activator NlpD